MDYSNPKIPEEINYSKENSLKEFFILVAGIFLVIGIFIASIHLLAQNFAHHIPFEYEKKIMSTNFSFNETNFADDDAKNLALKKQNYLSQLAADLASKMDLPEGMSININYVNQTTINAGATLNGQIIIYQGLLDFVESENELAMVIAHEIAHVKARHPIKALSSGLIIGISMSIISGSIDNGGAASIITSGSTLTSLNFSRRQETEADELALQALHAHYGHTNGSHNFFKRLHEQESFARYLQFLSTHPSSKERIEDLKKLEEQIQNNDTTAKLLLLPKFAN